MLAPTRHPRLAQGFEFPGGWGPPPLLNLQLPPPLRGGHSSLQLEEEVSDGQGYPRDPGGPLVCPHLIPPTLTHPNWGLEMGRGTQRQSLGDSPEPALPASATKPILTHPEPSHSTPSQCSCAQDGGHPWRPARWVGWPICQPPFPTFQGLPGHKGCIRGEASSSLQHLRGQKLLGCCNCSRNTGPQGAHLDWSVYGESSPRDKYICVCPPGRCVRNLCTLHAQECVRVCTVSAVTLWVSALMYTSGLDTSGGGGLCVTPLCVRVECGYLHLWTYAYDRVCLCPSRVVYVVAGCLWVLLACERVRMRAGVHALTVSCLRASEGFWDVSLGPTWRGDGADRN